MTAIPHPPAQARDDAAHGLRRRGQLLPNLMLPGKVVSNKGLVVSLGALMVAVGAMGPPGSITCYILTCNHAGGHV